MYFPLHFFAVFRAHELHNVEPFIGLLEPPVLDLGCGDGLISNLLFGRPLEYGIDPSESAVESARRSRAYATTLSGDAHRIPLPDRSLGGIFSNCVLEHVPDLAALYREVPGAQTLSLFRRYLSIPVLFRAEPGLSGR